MSECLGDGVCTNPRCPTHGIKWTFDGGTRSVEIPDEAVRAAVHAAGGTGAIEPVAMHAALVAARPYLRDEAFAEYAAMDERHLNSCIWIDPGRQSGEPCFGGTRIPVAPFMSIVEEAGDEAAKAFWPNVTDAHIVAGRAFTALLNGVES